VVFGEFSLVKFVINIYIYTVYAFANNILLQLLMKHHNSTHARKYSSKDYLRRLNEGSGNVDEMGNFSIQVLRAALQQQYDLSLPSIGQNDLDFGTRDITSYPGFVCNRSSHWFTIRSLGNKFWNLNSTLEKPQLISNFRLAAELEALQQSGYAVFVITARELPPPDRTTGLSQFWWHMSDLVGKNTINKNKTTDWNGIGLGRSLNDGKKKKELSTEKEMLQKALRASMMLPKMLPEEPIANSPNVVTIQFRFPNGTKHRRRFLSQQSIDIVYSYCQVETNEFDIELKYGFPPRILNNNNRTTVGDANLDGESIQVLIH